MTSASAAYSVPAQPHRLSWEHAPHFPWGIKTHLISACELFEARDFAIVLKELKWLHMRSMTQPQRLRIYYMRGVTFLQMRRYLDAEHAFRNAIRQLSPDESTMTAARLHYYLGLALHERQQLTAASQEHRASLAALDDHQWLTGERDLELRFENLRRLASQWLMLMRFDDSLAALEAAWPLAQEPQLSDAKRISWQGIIEWTAAITYRWQGAYETAYRHALSAVNLYDQAHDEDALARIQLVAADCGLDWVAHQHNDSAAQQQLPTIATLVESGRTLIAKKFVFAFSQDREQAKMYDDVGALLATLAQRRYERLTEQTNRDDRLADLYRLVGESERTWDAAMMGLAYLAYADELAYQGSARKALQFYKFAVGALKSVAPMLAIRARRAFEHGGALPSDALI